MFCLLSFSFGILSCLVLLRVLRITQVECFQILLGVTISRNEAESKRIKSSRKHLLKNAATNPLASTPPPNVQEIPIVREVEKVEVRHENDNQMKVTKESPKPAKEQESIVRMACPTEMVSNIDISEPRSAPITRKETSTSLEALRGSRPSASNVTVLSGAELKDKKLCGRRAPSTPLIVFPGRPVNEHEKNLKESNVHEKFLKHGWLEIGTKVGGQKLIWHRSYFCLQANWLSYYKNEQIRGDQCLGWVCLSGCHVYELGGRKKPKLVIERPKHRIFHKRGPDINAPPCSKKHYLFHKRSSKCRLRIGDQESLDEWVRALTQAASGDIKFSPESPVDSSEDESVPAFSTFSSISEEVKSVASMPLPETSSAQLLKTAESRPEPKVPPSSSWPFLQDSDSDSESDDPEIEEENRENLLKIVKKAIGLDITTISLPVSLNEPTSFLMRMCENFNNIDLLNQADLCEENELAMVYVSAFAIASWSNVVRTTKPFNPYLGETYEFIQDDFRFLAEQVSHHPPIGACHAENSHFLFWQEQGLKTKFHGNSLLCESIGKWHLVLKKSGQHYSWNGVKSVVHNVILGKMWIDHFGETEILNHSTGVVSHVEFTKCGWFNKGRNEVHADVLDTAGKTHYTISGKWNDSLRVTSFGSHQFEAPVWVHRSKPDPTNYWQLPEFCQKLIEMDEKLLPTLPKTDSRFRLDRIALERRDLKTAALEKRRLEDKERNKKRIREQKGEIWLPKYFTRREDDGFGGKDYLYNGTYWKDTLPTAT